ncbi:MAG: hypothetical protein DRQ10_04520 [Candidatus Hydrothermota bacterium]|nr:MAG: hypothetical protein DRQ10_04520 [Candidatus Hydrothermae bacterium]
MKIEVEIFERIAELRRQGKSCVLVTVVEKKGSGPAEVGRKMLVLPDGRFWGSVGGGTLEKLAIKKALEVNKLRRSTIHHYAFTENHDVVENAGRTGMVCGGNATLFFDYIGPKNYIYIFGAGHVGRAVARHLHGTGFFVTIIDNRKNVLEGLDVGDRIVHANYESALEGEDVPENGMFVVATHSHVFDVIALKRIFTAGWKPLYVGLLASKNKARTVVGKLIEELGEGLDLSRLYAPIGLDVGGKSPDEIAISIVAELLAVHYGKTEVKHLRLSWSIS